MTTRISEFAWDITNKNTMKHLEGFERVLCENFGCKHCQYLRKVIGEKRNLPEWNKFWASNSYVCPMGWNNNINSFKLCSEFRLSDETKAEIKLKDREIEDTKIDTHPRFSLGILSHIEKCHSFKNKEEWFFCSRKNIIFYNIYPNRPKDIKLELIL